MTLTQIESISNTTTKSNNSLSDLTKSLHEIIIAYASLLNLIFGVIGNIICFTVFISTPKLRKMSFIVYLTYCSLSNILSLFEWNLNHYIEPIYHIQIQYTNLFVCRLFIFIQYFSLQCSAYFLSWMSIDRFVSVIALPGSFASQLPFSSARSAHFWSIFIIIVIFSINSHLFILNGFYDPPEWRNMTTGTNQTTYLYQNPDFHCGVYWNLFKMWPFWDIVHLYIFSIVPFVIMMTFNLLLIVKTLLPKKKKSSSVLSNTLNLEKARLTKSLLAITFSFLILTVPSGIAFAYFYDDFYRFNPWIFNLLDYIALSHQYLLFFNCFATNNTFRNRILNFMKQCFICKLRFFNFNL